MTEIWFIQHDDIAKTPLKIPENLCQCNFAGYFLSFSPVKKYKEDHQYMDGVVCEDGDGVFLAGIHCKFSISTSKVLGSKSCR